MNVLLNADVVQAAVTVLATFGLTTLVTYTQTRLWSTSVIAGGIAAFSYVTVHYGTGRVQTSLRSPTAT